MSGNNHSVSCPKCSAENQLRGKALTVALTCQACGTYFRTGKWNRAAVEFQYKEGYQAIPIGARGKIDNFQYEVMGFVVKQETKYHFKWREYLLFSPYRGYAFLSEYNGHWNFVWPIESDPRKDISSDDFYHEGVEYRLYQKYSAQVVFAKGEFFFDVFGITESTVNSEFIAPPHMLALEKSHDSILWCQGEYFKPKEIAKAFSIPASKLPRKEGVGYTQPFNSSYSDKSLILFCVLVFLIALLAQVTLSSSAEDKVVFQRDYHDTDLQDQKMIATSSFDLTGDMRNVEIYIYAPVENNWFFSEFTLINDDTGDEYNFTKEVEFYSGYDEGYRWTEGSHTAEAILSMIPAGRYHINIYPEFNFNNHAFSMTVKRDVPVSTNFYVTAIALLLFPAFYFVRKNYLERKRWSDSDYSPYYTEEE